jgi:hypothetical protein
MEVGRLGCLGELEIKIGLEVRVAEGVGEGQVEEGFGVVE